MYGKKERSGGGKSVAEGKGRSRRFGAASPAGPGAAEQETHGATGATTLRDAPSRVVSTGFGMIPRFVRPPSKKRLRPSSPVALESERDDVLRPLGQDAVLRCSRERGAPLEDHRGEHSRRTEHRTGRRPRRGPAAGRARALRGRRFGVGGGELGDEDAPEHSTPGGAPGAAAPPSLEPAASLAHGTPPRPRPALAGKIRCGSVPVRPRPHGWQRRPGGKGPVARAPFNTTPLNQ